MRCSNNLRDTYARLRDYIKNLRSCRPVIYFIIIFSFTIATSFTLEKGLRNFYNLFLHANLLFNIQRLVLVLATFGVFFLTTIAYGKEGRSFVYRYRYLLGISLFILCVAMRINYSSAGIFDDIVQPSYITETKDIIIGVNRAIRSDEYVVGTPSILSQYQNAFGLVNPDIMADDTAVSFYPKLPNNTALSLLTSPQYLGFILLPIENAYSFYQLLPWFVAFFAVFEMLIVITKKRKVMSLIGTLAIIFSPVILWFDSVQYIMYVSLLFDILYLFIHHGKNWKSKLGFSVLFGWVAACFVMVIYPAWQVPYGYILLAFSIYLIADNHKRLSWQDCWYIMPAISIIIILVLPSVAISLKQYKLTAQTVYPGERLESGGGGLSSIFYYISSIFFPLFDIGNPCEASSFISFFPVPIILGIYTAIQSYRKRQPDLLLTILVILSLLLSFMCFIGNGFIARVTMLFLTPTRRLLIVLDLVCVFIIIRLFALHQARRRPKKPALVAIAAAIITAVLVFFGITQTNAYVNGIYMRPFMICAVFVLYYTVIYCIIDNRKETGYVVGIITVLFASYQFLTIHPLRSGLEIYFDKPVALKIRELSSKNQDALWLTSGTRLSSYAIANDARVINSVNYYPVLERWQRLDPDDKNEQIYNRYAHINIIITDKETTNFQLIATDAFKVSLNYKDICLLHPVYFLSDTNYSNIPGWSQKLIYDEDGIYIYQFDCK